MEVGERQLRRLPASTDWDVSVREGDTPCLGYEVLAIEAGGNQTITEGTFEK